MKVILYPRVSSKKQAEQGDSIDSQINRLKKFCEQNNYDIVDIYTDAGKSASISEDKINISISDSRIGFSMDLNKRPAFKKLLEDVESKKFEGIVFFKWDRFSRDSIFSKIAQIYFKRHSIELIPSDDSNDPLMIEIKGALSQEEVRKMKERVRLGRINKFDNGMMVGRCPVGYKMLNSGKVVLDNKEADMIKDIFKLASENINYKEICKKYNIRPQQYYNIIKNKVYMGIISFEGVEKPGIHEALVSKGLWEKVQR